MLSLKPMPRISAAFFLLGLTSVWLACSPNASLSELEQTRLEVTLQQNSYGTNGPNYLHVKLDFATSSGVMSIGSCNSFEDTVRAQIDGVDMELIHYGGTSIYLDECNTPEWGLNLDEEFSSRTSNTIVISDNSTEMTMSVDGLAIKRDVAAQSDLTQLHAGQQIALRWAPASDSLDGLSVAFYRNEQDTFNPVFEVTEDAITVENGLLSFVVPDRASAQQGTLEVYANSVRPRVSLCDGLESCESTVTPAEISLEATIVP